MLGPGAGACLRLADQREIQDEGGEATLEDVKFGRDSTTSCSSSSEHASKHASVAALFGQTLEGTPFFAACAFSAVTYAPLTSFMPSE